MIDRIRKSVEAGEYRFTFHALERCIERDISPEQIKAVLLTGELIENYPQDKYGPSCLIYGVTKTGRKLHVHCSAEPLWIITVYDPTLSPDEWNEDFRTRRIKP